MTNRAAVFLDRDGVINEDLAYVHRKEDFHFLPDVLSACKTLAGAGFLLVVVTNQAGIAHGYYTQEDFGALTAWMADEFRLAGAPLAGVYFCPHHPAASVPALRQQCDCRKPAPGLLLRAANELHIDLPNSILIGDKLSDIDAARAAGVEHRFLVRSTTNGLPNSPSVAGHFLTVLGVADVARRIKRTLSSHA